MKVIPLAELHNRLQDKKFHSPLSGQIELTYRCNLNCIHCYSNGLEVIGAELTTLEWKRILDDIQREGCIYLTFTGGEPLLRQDFLELYAHAKSKGFIITIFTNGCIISKEILDYLAKSPPFSIEITLNGISKQTYEEITKITGSFAQILGNIKKIKEKKLSLILKSNCLKQNKDEIGRIKSFADNSLGRKNGRYHFKYDPMIYPRLNQDKEPTCHRLSFSQLKELKQQDGDIWKEFKNDLNCAAPDLKRGKEFLYQCNSWMQQFFVNPYGRLKFCMFSEKFSVDLKVTPFREGFYRVFPQLLKERFKTGSKCKDCNLRSICYYCPARAFLEAGNEEGPVPYYCRLAEETAKEIGLDENRTRQ